MKTIPARTSIFVACVRRRTAESQQRRELREMLTKMIYRNELRKRLTIRTF